MKRGVLVPRRHQPVRGQRGGQCAADHEAEMARPGAGHQAGLGAGHQRVDDGVRVLAVLRQRTAESIAHAGGIDAGGHRALVEAGEKLPGVLRGGGQAGGAIAHGKTLSAVGDYRPNWSSMMPSQICAASIATFSLMKACWVPV